MYVSVKDNDGWITLDLVAVEGHLEVIKYLIEQQVEVNAKDDRGSTSLPAAAYNGHLEVVKWLEMNRCSPK